MKFGLRAAIVALVLALAGVAHAQSAATRDAVTQDPGKQLETLKRYGAVHKACDGWSDGCALCARRADGTLGCSRLGVDCQVADIQCTQLSRDPATGKTPPPQ